MGGEQQCRLDHRDVWYEWNWKWFGRIHRRYQYRGYTDGNAHHWWSRVYRKPGGGRNFACGSDSYSSSDSCSHSDSDSDSHSHSGSRLPVFDFARRPEGGGTLGNAYRQSLDNQHLRVDSQ